MNTRPLRDCATCKHGGVQFLFPPTGSMLARITCRHPFYRDSGNALLAIVPAGEGLDAITVAACPLLAPSQTVGDLLAEVGRDAAMLTSWELGYAPQRPPELPRGERDEPGDDADSWKT